MCFLLMTLVPVQRLCVNIYIYMHSLYEFCYRTYIHIQRECHSVLAKLHPITFYCISGECMVPGLNATFCFLWFTNCVLLFDKSLIIGCLWPLVFILNNILNTTFSYSTWISCQHWNQKIVMLTFSSLVAPEVVRMTTSGAASDEKVVNMMTFLFQWMHTWKDKNYCVKKS